jgi:hypothetical protein
MAGYQPYNDVIDKTGASVYRGVFETEEKLNAAYPHDLAGATAAVYSDATEEGGWFVFIYGMWVPLGRINGALLGRPENITPADKALNVNQLPQFQGSLPAYTNALIDHIIFEVFRSEDGLSLVCRDLIYTPNTYFTSKAFNKMIIEHTIYYWSITYIFENGRQTLPSRLTSFSTQQTFTTPIIQPPNITYPISGARIATNNLFVLADKFTTVPPYADTHKSTDWRVRSDLSRTDGDLAMVTDEEDQKTSYYFPMEISGKVYVDCRYKGDTIATPSSWSNAIELSPRRYYNNSGIGVAFRCTENGIEGRHIDVDGLDISIENDYFDNHPAYQMPTVNILGNEMVAIPRLYVKTYHNPNANIGEDKYRYWLSLEPFDGAYLHSAFRRTTGPLYLSKWWSGDGTPDGTIRDFGWAAQNSLQNNTDVFTSKPGTAKSYPSANLATLNLTSGVTSYNTNADANHRGWRVWSVYDQALLYLMMIIETRSFNPANIMDPTISWKPPYYNLTTQQAVFDAAPTSHYRNIFAPWVYGRWSVLYGAYESGIELYMYRLVTDSPAGYGRKHTQDWWKFPNPSYNLVNKYLNPTNYGSQLTVGYTFKPWVDWNHLPFMRSKMLVGDYASGWVEGIGDMSLLFIPSKAIALTKPKYIKESLHEKYMEFPTRLPLDDPAYDDTFLKKGYRHVMRLVNPTINNINDGDMASLGGTAITMQANGADHNGNTRDVGLIRIAKDQI